MSYSYKVGIAIAVHNSENVIRQCLSEIKDSGHTFVIFDDASTDNTISVAKSIIPEIIVLKGDGNSWWAGGTAKAVDKCFSLGCDFVLMLNPDTLINPTDIEVLVRFLLLNKKTIVTGIIVPDDNHNKLFWGGSHRIVLGKFVHANKYIYKTNTSVDNIANGDYATDEVHGRGVLVSREVYDFIGTLDCQEFPHYGADNDYSLRARAAGIAMRIVPSVKIRLIVDNSGMYLRSKPFSYSRLVDVYKYFVDRKHGEFVKTSWRLTKRHVPLLSVVPTFIFSIMYIMYRKLSQK